MSAIERAVISVGGLRYRGRRGSKSAGGVRCGQENSSIGPEGIPGSQLSRPVTNVDMDLEPFARINPCGYPDLEVTSMAQLLHRHDLDSAALGCELLDALEQEFSVDREG